MKWSVYNNMLEIRVRKSENVEIFMLYNKDGKLVHKEKLVTRRVPKEQRLIKIS